VRSFDSEAAAVDAFSPLLSINRLITNNPETTCGPEAICLGTLEFLGRLL
jgi:hypothetical protein